MPNTAEVIRNYAFNLTKRVVGRSAWEEAMAEPSSWGETYTHGARWARGINRAIENGAHAFALLELIAPATSKVLTSNIRNPEKLAQYSPVIATGIAITSMLTDTALLVAIGSFSRSPQDFIALKLAANVATQAGVDLASYTARKIRSLKPPTTTFAV